MKRVFIAIDIKISSELHNRIKSYRDMLRHEKIRWVEPANMHLTLAFLGEMDEDQVRKAGTIMKEIVADYSSFPIDFAETGVFRSINHPRVIWIGLKAPDILYEMRENLCRKLREADLYRDEKKFSPHITLGRMKYISNRDLLSDITGPGQNNKIPSQTIREVILFESILKPEGPVYSALLRAEFNDF